ncbi:MAG: hypothetical protein GXY05_15495, partial [Clostridiales bacterium]|nr:hypothetical protein [Clostridiales bacterium]
MNLCADKADGTSYFIDAEYTEGCLKISGQDLGKLPEEIFGRDEYEYFYSLDEFNTNKLIS